MTTKTPSIDNPVTPSWLKLNGRRLDGRPYVSGDIEAKVLLEKLRAEKVPLQELTQGGINGLINAGRIARMWVTDPAYGLPFLSSTDILQADLNNLSLIAKKAARLNPLLIIHEGWTLITRSGTIGRIAYCRPDMSGMACTEDVLRVVPDSDKILPGYLYAYLNSKFGVPQVIGGTYGTIIQHIEPHHLADLPVPRLGKDLEEATHQRVDRAARLRSEYQAQIKEATDLLFRSVGLHDITASEWHAMGRDLGFSRVSTSHTSLRSLNFNPRLEACLTKVAGTTHMTLGEICRGGKLQRSTRFTRVECEEVYGVKLVGQRELFWLEPEGRWISPRHAPSDIFVQDETIVVAAQGTLGENEVFCRAEFITGPWLNYAYTEHLLRVQSGNPAISGAFLFAFMRSEMVFRCLRSMSVGSKQQDLHRELLAQLPVPLPSENVRSDIEKLIRDAFAKRPEASKLEKEAIAMVEEVIQEGTRWQPLSQ